MKEVTILEVARTIFIILVGIAFLYLCYKDEQDKKEKEEKKKKKSQQEEKE